LGKPRFTRSIKAGRLSASRKEDGSYEIDPAELSRVYPFPAPGSETPETGQMVQDATPDPSRELELKNAALEQEVRDLKELLSEVRGSRDALQETVTR